MAEIENTTTPDTTVQTPAQDNPTLNLNFSDDDFRRAAEQCRTEIFVQPVLACEDTLKHMTVIPGIRGKYHYGTAGSNAQFAPFNAFRKSASSMNVVFRTLETFLGSFQEDFVPNQYITTLLGRSADFFGEGQRETPSAKLVLQAVMASCGMALHDALFTAKRDETGDETSDLFDGWGTIADNEIADGTIAESKGNLMAHDAITTSNVMDTLKSLERGANPILRAMKKNLYCAPEVLDAYNDAYLLTHGATPYNQKFEQTFLEGSSNKTTIIALPSLAGSDKMYLTPKENMLFGCDTMGDVERLEILRTKPFVLTLAAAMFFGTNFYSIDPRFLRVAKISKK